jgi:hypothetical protein
MKQLKFRIQPNTDTVDIDAKCLGLSTWVPGDSTNELNSNRGLHIQIRHNRDKATFEAANQLSRLISMAPTMLSGLKLAVMEFERISYQKKCNPEILENLKTCIAKAKSEFEGG